VTYKGRHVRLRRSRRWPWLLVPALAVSLTAPSNTDEFPAVTTTADLTPPPPSRAAERQIERPRRLLLVQPARQITPPKPRPKAKPVVDHRAHRRRLVLTQARKMLGIPYVWGGNGLSGLDCSGFTVRAYAAAGIQLPRFSGAQHFKGTRVSEPQPGDLVWWGPWRGGGRHVAIYFGNNQIIGARHRGTVSAITPLWGSPRYYRMF
jgi:cell wall-associated NlpC family hydrolase